MIFHCATVACTDFHPLLSQKKIDTTPRQPRCLEDRFLSSAKQGKRASLKEVPLVGLAMSVGFATAFPFGGGGALPPTRTHKKQFRLWRSWFGPQPPSRPFLCSCRHRSAYFVDIPVVAMARFKKKFFLWRSKCVKTVSASGVGTQRLKHNPAGDTL